MRRSQRSASSRATLALAALLMAACAPVEDEPDTPSGLTVLALGPTPTLEVGLVEGDPNYAFQDVVSTVRLPSGNLAVADAGSDVVSIFSAQGTFLRHVGGRGEGPGEFRDLMRVYPRGTDSIDAADGSMRTLFVFDTAGTYARQFSALEASEDTMFALDAWLYRRFWVDGALESGARASVRAALDALPRPSASPGYRVVRVAEDGRLWIQEPAVAAAETRTWIVTDPSGRPTSVIEMPTRFDPQDIDADAVTGRWIGESDVHFVRSYRVTETTEIRAPPSWLAGSAAAAGPPAPDEAEFLAEIRTALRSMASAQEMHYSEHYTYTSAIDSLRWERQEGIDVHFTGANARGWTAVFTHPGLDRICALAYGDNLPAGWSPGEVLCSPAPASSATRGS